jgi:hypothetical protein
LIPAGGGDATLSQTNHDIVATSSKEKAAGRQQRTGGMLKNYLVIEKAIVMH